METTVTTRTAQRLLPLNAVEDLTGYRKSKLYDLLKQGTFPQPVRIGRSIKFVEAEIGAWVAARIAERDASVSISRAALVTENDVSTALKVSTSFLQKDRRKEHPSVPFVRVGPHVRYDLGAVRDALGVT